MTKIIAVVPSATHPTQAPASSVDDDWIYDVKPCRLLPEIDLSRTIKSEFLSPRVNRIFLAMRRVHRVFFTAHIFTTASFFVTMVAPASVGRWVILVGTLVGIPGNCLLLVQLRYDLIKLQMHTFDVWFTSVTWLVVFAILAIIFSDLRAIIILSFLLGAMPNVWHDACIATIRPLIIFNIACIFVCILIILSVNASFTDGLHDFVVVRFRESNHLRRLRDDRRHHAAQRVPSSRHPAAADRICGSGTCCLPLPARPKMRLGKFINRVDVRHTTLPRAVKWLLAANPHTITLIPLTAYAGLSATIVYVLCMTTSIASLQVQTQILTIGLSFTGIHCLLCALLYNRALVAVIYTSFDFVFFMAQLRIHRFFPRLLVLCMLAAGVLLVYNMIFADPPATIVNRVVWDGKLLHFKATYTLLPQFYSALTMVFFLSLRFCWRQWRLTGNELVVIDGPVVFTNSFAHSRTRFPLPLTPVGTHSTSAD